MVMLEIQNAIVHYGEAIAVQKASVSVETGELVCLLGPNGAGKTTLLNTICGLIRPSAGAISFLGKDISNLSAAAIQRMGISQVPEGRKIFSSLTVLENLKVGAYSLSDDNAIKEDLDRYTEMFPILKTRKNQRGGSLSGGEQQIVAIIRALMSRPKLILLDEPSLGLAPLFIKQIYEIINDIHQQNTAILLVEQNARMALEISSRAYIMDAGKIVISGPSPEIVASDEVKKAYLGE
jgi:branched-chain amino acid transport system ATP-binding protein